MTTRDPLVDRRTALRAVGSVALGASLAGCSTLGSIADENDDVVLDPPENFERVADVDLPHPKYGEKLPEVTLPAPLHDREVTTSGFVGDRHVMMTFVFTSCPGVCVGLTSALRQVQADSIEEGYADEVAFLPVTFDPEYDTAEVLREYGENMGVDFDAGNWYFLRPETPERAKEVVEGRFGVAFERVDDGDEDGHDDPTGAEDGHEQAGEEGGDSHERADGGDDSAHEGDDAHEGHGRNFVHSSLILLVNEGGYVERAYTGGPPDAKTIVGDARDVVEGW